MNIKLPKLNKGLSFIIAGLLLLIVFAGGVLLTQSPGNKEISLSPINTPSSSNPTASPVATSYPSTRFATASPSAEPTYTLSPAPTPIPSPTASVTPSPSATTIPWSERAVIGYSVQGNPIELVRLGHGERWFVLLGALHGGHECNTSGVVEGIIAHFTNRPDELPNDVTIYAIPLINQDGCTTYTRSNANGVDLNRNWDTPDWQTDAEASAGVIVGSGGSYPFSQPETQLLRDWLLALQANAPTGSLAVISYHSVVPQTGLVQPGYLSPGEPGFLSAQMALNYSEATGYLYSATWVGGYTITGEFIHWANLQGIVAMDVELPDGGAADTIPAGWAETHFETNLRGVIAVMNLGEGIQSGLVHFRQHQL